MISDRRDGGRSRLGRPRGALSCLPPHRRLRTSIIARCSRLRRLFRNNLRATFNDGSVRVYASLVRLCESIATDPNGENRSDQGNEADPNTSCIHVAHINLLQRNLHEPVDPTTSEISGLRSSEVAGCPNSPRSVFPYRLCIPRPRRRVPRRRARFRFFASTPKQSSLLPPCTTDPHPRKSVWSHVSISRRPPSLRI
jgi:hypothetical protein